MIADQPVDPFVDPEDLRRASHEGMSRMALPTRRELIDRYGERTGLDLSAVGWYEAFAQRKTAVLVQQLHHRWLVGDSTDERMETIAESIPTLVEAANRLLADAG